MNATRPLSLPRLGTALASVVMATLVTGCCHLPYIYVANSTVEASAEETNAKGPTMDVVATAERLGLREEDHAGCVMLGNNLARDIAGANRLGKTDRRHPGRGLCRTGANRLCRRQDETQWSVWPHATRPAN